MSEFTRGARPELLRGEQQFDAVEQALIPILSRFKFYYSREGQSPGIEGPAILQALRSAKVTALSGTLASQKAIRLFGGLQSPHIWHPEESANRRIVQALYNNLHQIVRPEDARSIDPRTIERDSIRYGAFPDKDLTYDPEATDFPVTRFGTAALRDVAGKLTGVQMQLGENIFAHFWVDRMLEYAEVRRSTADLIIHPSTAE